MWEIVANTTWILIQPENVIFLLGGVALGLVFGALPGLSTTMAVALMLPLTFSFTPTVGIAMLVAIYIGGISGSSVSAILLRIPGTAASIATTFDGYPLAQSGRPIQALGTAILASFFGGLIGFAVLVSAAAQIVKVAVQLGPFEYAALAFMALTLVGTLAGREMRKGLLAALLGVGISLIGLAPIDAQARYTFGSVQLLGGISVVPFLIGLYAASQLFRQAGGRALNSDDLQLKGRGFGVAPGDIMTNLKNILRSSLIGVGIGSLPGIGSAAANIVAYGAAKRAAKAPDTFGTGVTAGIWAPESSNNASVAGALLPLITLGIPGGGVTAVMLGGLTIHGLQPGPLLMRNSPDAVAAIYSAFLLACIFVVLIQLFTIRIFPKVLLVPPGILVPTIFMVTVTGVYISDYRIFDVFLMLGIGALGFVMERYHYPLAPMVLGFVIGPILEANLRRALMLSRGDWSPFVTSWISLCFLAIAVVVIVTSATKSRSLAGQSSKTL